MPLYTLAQVANAIGKLFRTKQFEQFVHLIGVQHRMLRLGVRRFSRIRGTLSGGHHKLAKRGFQTARVDGFLQKAGHPARGKGRAFVGQGVGGHSHDRGIGIGPAPLKDHLRGL